MQLEQFAGIVFIGGAGSGCFVVEIIQHGRRACDLAQKLAKIAERMFAHDFVVLTEIGCRVLVAHRVDAEMVMPELGQNFANLRVRMHGADQRRRLHLTRRPDTLFVADAILLVVKQRQQFLAVRVLILVWNELVSRFPCMALVVLVRLIFDAQRGGAEALLNIIIRNRFRQFAIQPCFKAKLFELGNRRGVCAESQPVERLCGEAGGRRRKYARHVSKGRNICRQSSNVKFAAVNLHDTRVSVRVRIDSQNAASVGRVD